LLNLKLSQRSKTEQLSTELYAPSVWKYFAPEQPEYPCHDRTITIIRCGRICIRKRKK